MSWMPANFWIIPALPLVAAGILAITPRRGRSWAAGLATAAMLVAVVFSALAFGATLGAGSVRAVRNFNWFEMGHTWVQLGWILDPLSATMLVMVSVVGALIFAYSIGYMAADPNVTRFFCFLALFAAGMLGMVIANHLLLLFICWELVGLSSYLLIGFWHQRPRAAAAAKKAFIVTRIGDLGLFVGMLWLYSQTGTLLLYDGGHGCLEASALGQLARQTTLGGMAVSTAIALLILCGAIGKSGQVPLHVWLPDAMEGPTPVSALIHAATMVAAGVFLLARMYPLMDADLANLPGHSTALSAVTWVGVITAVFAASIAVAQTDIKRVLAYSTVSQLGYMMFGLGAGGVAVGMFHLVTHALFKALLFLGGGSVIHACQGEHDIRRMGGLARPMPITFATYAVGMMALTGVPLFFSGFWSKDEILHSAWLWPPSRWPFYLGVIGALLTAFYMTRQLCWIFCGPYRGADASAEKHLHESPPVITVPLLLLAAGVVLLSVIGTPFWPWLEAYLTGRLNELQGPLRVEGSSLWIMALSTMVAGTGIALGWWYYGRRPAKTALQADPLDVMQPEVYSWLRAGYFIDEVYQATLVRLTAWIARASNWLDQFVWNGLVQAVAWCVVGLGWVSRLTDELVVNLGFDRSCGSIRTGGRLLSWWQNGQVQRYLRIMALGLAALVLLFIWGGR